MSDADAREENPTADSTDVSTTNEQAATASADSPVPSSASVSETTKSTTVASPKPKVVKVDILLKPAGDAPIMKQKKWTVERTKRIGEISTFIKKYIKIDPANSVFLYVNQAFAPSPDATVGTLFDCFGSDGKLVLHYCKTQAWG